MYGFKGGMMVQGVGLAIACPFKGCGCSCGANHDISSVDRVVVCEVDGACEIEE
jgi:hypothetical protein